MLPVISFGAHFSLDDKRKSHFNSAMNRVIHIVYKDAVPTSDETLSLLYW